MIKWINILLGLTGLAVWGMLFNHFTKKLLKWVRLLIKEKIKVRR